MNQNNTNNFDNNEIHSPDESFKEETFSKKVQNLDINSDQDKIRIKEDNDLKVVETVFDNKTRLILMSMINKGVINEVGGSISTGKEANVYFAPSDPAAKAVKIFRIDVTSFKKMRPYIEGDHRFKRFRSSRSGFIETWTKKEFKNLQRMSVHNIPCPKPLNVERNILVMEYLGSEGAVLPKLKDSKINKPRNLYKRIMNSVKDLYQKAKLVHADLSEYNILFDENKNQYYLIDVSQSVLWDHPNAQHFLLRDLNNINRFFNQFSIEIIEIKTLYKWITSEDPDEIMLSEISKK